MRVEHLISHEIVPLANNNINLPLGTPVLNNHHESMGSLKIFKTSEKLAISFRAGQSKNPIFEKNEADKAISLAVEEKVRQLKMQELKSSVRVDEATLGATKRQRRAPPSESSQVAAVVSPGSLAAAPALTSEVLADLGGTLAKPADSGSLKSDDSK